MSQSFLDRMQTVGYMFEEKKLIVMLSDKMAQKMKADGWSVQTEEELGTFIAISLTKDVE